LQMYENKFKLWRVLHPEFMQMHERFKNVQDMCGKCLHSPTIEGVGVKMLHCPLKRLVTDDFKKVVVLEPGHAYKYCVEWIKHV